MHKNLLLTIIFWITALGLSAQKAVVDGKVPSNPEAEVTLYKVEDYISGRKSVVQTNYSDVNGNFQFNLFPDDIQEFIIRVDERNTRFFVMPKTVYNITIPPFPDDEPQRFYVPLNWVEPLFQSLDPDDINALISDFNNRYEKFYADHYPEIAKAQNSGHSAFKRRQRSVLEDAQLITNNDSISQSSSRDVYFNLIHGFERALDSVYADIDNNYFENYRNYAIGEMKLSAGLLDSLAYGMYLKDRPVLVNHPEYINFFSSFHGDVFYRFANAKEGSPFKEAVNNEKGYAQVAESLNALYPYVGQPEEMDLLILTQVQRVFGANIFSKNALLALLSDLAENGSTEQLKKIAGNVRMELARGMAGMEIESFRLLNEKNEQVTLEDFEGKYVYINFYSSWCTSCVKEMTLIDQLENEYGRQIAFLSISMDKEYTDFRNFLAANRAYNWQFLYGAGDKLLQEKLGIYSLPFYLMIDPEGKRMFSHTPMPSEGIEKIFHKIKYEATKPEKIKVWDD